MWSPGCLLGLALFSGLVQNPDALETAVARGRVFLELRSYERAVEQFTEAAQLAPADDQIQFLLGLALYGAGRADAAVEPFRRAATARPDDALAHEFLGRVLFQNGQLAEAAAALAVVERLDPADARNLNQLGAVLLRLGRADEALEHFEAALARDGDYAVAHYNAGVLLAVRGDVLRGAQHLEAAARLDPNDGDPPEALGDLRYELGELGEATRWYEETLRRRDSVAVWLRLAATWVERGDPVAAEAALAAACRLPGAPAEPFRRRAQLLRGRGDFATALGCLEQAVLRNPDDVDLRRAAADLAEDQGELRRARDQLLAVVALGDSAPDILGRLSRLHEALGQPDVARAVFERLVGSGAGSHTELVAIAERMVSSSIDGIRDLETGRQLAHALVSRSHGRDLAALYVLSRAEQALGDGNAAATTLQRAARLFEPGTPVFALLQRRAEQLRHD